MKQKCKVCGANADSEYCFRHKPRKPLPASWLKPRRKTDLKDYHSTPNGEGVIANLKMQHFFIGIWKIRPHKSELSGAYLGNEALSVFFHHILPKSKYPQAMYDEENIILLTLNEHESVELDMYKYEEINRRRELLKQKYGIA